MEAYLDKYKDAIKKDAIESDVNDDLVINDELKDTYIECDAPRKTPISENDLKTLFDNIYSNL